MSADFNLWPTNFVLCASRPSNSIHNYRQLLMHISQYDMKPKCQFHPIQLNKHQHILSSSFSIIQKKKKLQIHYNFLRVHIFSWHNQIPRKAGALERGRGERSGRGRRKRRTSFNWHKEHKIQGRKHSQILGSYSHITYDWFDDKLGVAEAEKRISQLWCISTRGETIIIIIIYGAESAVVDPMQVQTLDGHGWGTGFSGNQCQLRS